MNTIAKERDYIDELIDRARATARGPVMMHDGLVSIPPSELHGILSSKGRVMAQTYPAAPAIVHPLAAPTISGTTMTVDMALQNPTRVTRTLMDLTLEQFFIDRVFASGGGVTGGAVIYDQLTANELYLTRDVQMVAPGAEFPIIDSARRAPKVATPEKWGGKFMVTDEARDRNNIVYYQRQVRQLANTMVRKLNQRGVEVLEAAITANSRTITGNNWAAVVTSPNTQSNATLWPARDFARAQYLLDIEEMGQNINLWIMNPQEYLQLTTLYGTNLSSVLGQFGLNIFVTNRIPAGTAYALGERQVGQMLIESPLATETWRDPRGIQATWTQTSVRPLLFADNLFAILKFQGLAG